MFVQPFVQAHIKENIKAPRHWSLWGESTDDRWIPSQISSNAKMLPFGNVIMRYSIDYAAINGLTLGEMLLCEKCYIAKKK